MCKFSFLIPVYNSERTIRPVVQRIAETMKQFDDKTTYEIVLVDDGSSDGVFPVICDLRRENPRVRPYRLSRNFGQANALMAGLSQVNGDYVVCLDDDLQTPPEAFTKLYEKLIEQDADVVYAYYPEKRHSLFRNIGTRLNALMQIVVFGKPPELETSSYFIAKKAVVDVVKGYDKPFPYLPGLFMQATGRIACVPVQHASRTEGRSGYTFRKLVNLWLDGFTNFSIRPLRFTTLAGLIIAAIAFVLLLFVLIQKLIVPQISEGWSSIIAVILFIGGVQLLSVGLLGEYVGRIYLSVNKTPQFVIRDKPMQDHDLADGAGQNSREESHG